MNWPHNVIVDRCNKGEPLMVRYYLTPKILGFRLVLHKFLRSDNNRFFHDHPWNFITFIFKGPGYFEHQPNGIFFRKRFSVLFRRKTHQHFVELMPILTESDRMGFYTVWPLVLFFGKRREWGFITPKGWVKQDLIDC